MLNLRQFFCDAFGQTVRHILIIYWFSIFTHPKSWSTQIILDFPHKYQACSLSFSQFWRQPPFSWININILLVRFVLIHGKGVWHLAWHRPAWTLGGDKREREAYHSLIFSMDQCKPSENMQQSHTYMEKLRDNDHHFYQWLIFWHYNWINALVCPSF